MNDKLILPLIDLHEWDKNPRSIDKENFKSLKQKLDKKSQFKPLLVTPDTDGTYTVLAGNMRLKAYQELGVPEVWVSILTFHEIDGMWQVALDGQLQSERFNTKDDAMMDWSLTENERAGYYDLEAFANIKDEFSLEWGDYEIDVKKPLTIPDLLKEYGISDEEDDNEEDEKKEEKKFATCPNCQTKFEV